MWSKIFRAFNDEHKKYEKNEQNNNVTRSESAVLEFFIVIIIYSKKSEKLQPFTVLIGPGYMYS